jgi:hypothetical protein
MVFHSILIAAYNRFDYLKATIESCLASSDADFEVIVSDDGSKKDAADRFYSYIEGLDNRIRIIRHEVNRGVGYRFAELQYEANGELLHLIGSDDLFHPLRLTATKYSMQEIKSYNTIFCSTAKHLSQEHKLMPMRTNYIGSAGHKACLFFQPHVVHPTVCTWNPALSGLQPYREKLRAAVDYCFYVDNFFQSQFVSFKIPLTYLVHSSTGISRDKDTRCNQLAMHDFVMHRQWSYFIKCSLSDISAIRQIVVSSEGPQVDITQYNAEKISRLKHIVASVREAALASCNSYSVGKDISMFAYTESQQLEYKTTLVQYFTYAASRINEFLKTQYQCVT